MHSTFDTRIFTWPPMCFTLKYLDPWLWNMPSRNAPFFYTILSTVNISVLSHSVCVCLHLSVYICVWYVHVWSMYLCANQCTCVFVGRPQNIGCPQILCLISLKYNEKLSGGKEHKDFTILSKDKILLRKQVSTHCLSRSSHFIPH